MPNNVEFLHQLDTSSDRFDPVTEILNRNIEEYLRGTYVRMMQERLTTSTHTYTTNSYGPITIGRPY